MDEELLTTQIKKVKELHSNIALEKIIYKMQPLIKKYVKKLYFMEKEDAMQELNLALIETIYGIKNYDNEAMCLTYIQKSIANKFYFLYKQYMRTHNTIDDYAEIPDDIISYNDGYKTIELYIDIKKILNNKSTTHKRIILYIVLYGLSDYEISKKLNISRQYVNRIKKKILKDYLIK